MVRNAETTLDLTALGSGMVHDSLPQNDRKQRKADISLAGNHH